MNALLEARGSEHFATPIDRDNPAGIDWSEVEINEFGDIVSAIGYPELRGEPAYARFYAECCTEDYRQRSHPCEPDTGVQYWEIPISPQDILYFYRLSWEYMNYTTHTARSRGFMHCARKLEGNSAVLLRKYENIEGKPVMLAYFVR